VPIPIIGQKVKLTLVGGPRAGQVLEVPMPPPPQIEIRSFTAVARYKVCPLRVDNAIIWYAIPDGWTAVHAYEVLFQFYIDGHREKGNGEQVVPSTDAQVSVGGVDMNHSPEPWQPGERTCIGGNPSRNFGTIFDADGQRVIVVRNGKVWMKDVDAERIVLCVNACREISDQDLATVTNPAYVARFQVDKEHNCVHLEIESDVRTISPSPPQL